MKTTNEIALAALRNIADVAAKNAEHGSADWCFVRDEARAAIRAIEPRFFKVRADSMREQAENAFAEEESQTTTT